MALDGIVVSHIVSELQEALIGGRIDKIYQPEKDELLLSVRNQKEALKLFLTAGSNYPRIHLTTRVKNTSNTPPMFCMLLRKHLSSGRIMNVSQPGFERIVQLDIEATNELGDRENKRLIIEMMGRHSNIILTKADGTIIDSIKHISALQSSMRELLPGKPYFHPNNQTKLDPSALTKESFIDHLNSLEVPLFKALYTTYQGLSPMVSHALCHAAGMKDETLCNLLSSEESLKLYKVMKNFMDGVKKHEFVPTLFLDETDHSVDFYSFPLSESFPKSETYPSLSELLEHFYYDQSTRSVVSQKTADIKKLLLNFIERNVRKKAIQEKAIESSEDAEIYKIYGELLTAYSFQVPAGAKSFETANYYSENYEMIEIPLDPQLTAIENAQKYFKHYNKAKRTLVAAHEQLEHINEELDYLNSVLVSLDFLQTQADIDGLRLELIEMGYLKKRKVAKTKVPKNVIPYMHFESSEGHTIYVGKNNYQNDELTMKFAKTTDMWLHIKDGPGSHVIIKLNPGEAPNDVTLIEAAMLAAYFSKAKFSSNVAIDYTYRKNVKKVPNAKPGMVIYTNFNTVYVTPDEKLIKSLEKGIQGK
ncbi:NFACT RNA binding domain-containing protein [Niameybacter massiliensis]|uniref:Rqc2 homolog RqcH n=1 Tax=Holtiella tumoricola TaxID=3018743 RepID=A0AA42J2F4_9FIRM|nr:NFACT RNA binding domain-containing protein [Holtiella tumoricola]MDA3733098.1 NFACT RNA binding domain-containing protein [Holtiella tumoricola]